MIKPLISTANMTAQEWRQFRKTGIGGSDASTVCRLNKYKSVFQLWAEKTDNGGDKEDEALNEENEAMYWGTTLEPIVREEFIKRTGFDVSTRKAVFQHPEHKFMLANIDGIVHNTDGEFVFEAKTANFFKTDEWNIDYVPLGYQLQVQHYMAVLGLKGAFVAVLIGGNSFRHCFIERDEETISMLITLEKQFWSFVETNTPPPIDGSESAKNFLNSLYPKANKGKFVVLDESCLNLVTEFERCQSEEKRFGELKDKASNELKQLMGDNEQAKAGERVISWKNVETERFDTKRFSNEQPDIYKKYINKSSYRRFSIK